MKKFIEDPIRVFLSTIATAFVFFVLFLFTTSCESRSAKHFRELEESKTAYEVVNHNTKAIIVETLHSHTLHYGTYKMTIDKVEYIVVVNHDGTAIIKHQVLIK